jgi:hypothetical protein
MNWLRRINLLPAAIGLAIGAATILVIQPSLTAQQNKPAKATYQIAPIAQAEANTFRVWRLNNATGYLEFCRVTNYSGWVLSNKSLEGRCATMPPPSI